MRSTERLLLGMGDADCSRTSSGLSTVARAIKMMYGRACAAGTGAAKSFQRSFPLC